eukprot:758444-Hanusia_phi.AAC.6
MSCYNCAMEMYVVSPGVCKKAPLKNQYYDTICDTLFHCPTNLGVAISINDCVDPIGCNTDEYWYLQAGHCTVCPAVLVIQSVCASNSIGDCKAQHPENQSWDSSTSTCVACATGTTSPAYASSNSGACDTKGEGAARCGDRVAETGDQFAETVRVI